MIYFQRLSSILSIIKSPTLSLFLNYLPLQFRHLLHVVSPWIPSGPPYYHLSGFLIFYSSPVLIMLWYHSIPTLHRPNPLSINTLHRRLRHQQLRGYRFIYHNELYERHKFMFIVSQWFGFSTLWYYYCRFRYPKWKNNNFRRKRQRMGSFGSTPKQHKHDHYRYSTAPPWTRLSEVLWSPCSSSLAHSK